MQDDQNSGLIEDASIRLVRRCIAVLQAVNRGRPVNLAEIAREARIPNQTAFRLIRALVQEGMIEQEPTRKYYRPTALVQSLSQGYQDYSRLAVISRPYIVDFTAETNWPAYIATPVGQRMIVRDGTYTLTPMTLNYYYPGFAFPLLESASGRVCLAFFEEEERRRYLDGIVASGEAVDMFILNSFRSGTLAADIRARGYANIGRNRATEFTDKTLSVAAPIFSNGRVVAAVSVVVFARAMRVEEAENLYGPRLASIGQAISEKLSMAD